MPSSTTTTRVRKASVPPSLIAWTALSAMLLKACMICPASTKAYGSLPTLEKEVATVDPAVAIRTASAEE
jgi:hypothetical protein